MTGDAEVNSLLQIASDPAKMKKSSVAIRTSEVQNEFLH